MTKNYEELEKILERSRALHASITLFEWDTETLAPEEADHLTSKIIGALSSEYYQIMTSVELKQAIEACLSDASLTDIETAIVKEAERERLLLDCVPAHEYRNFAELTSKATRVWVKAKKEGDFSIFAPTLEQVVSYQKKFASYRTKPGHKIYDTMLDTYEKGFDMELLDQFFSLMKEEILPLAKLIISRGRYVEAGFLTGEYSQEKQKKLAVFLAEYLGFDFKRGVLAESAHPFSTNLHNHDVRITTHYTDNVASSIFSVMHEAGHGIYEQGISDELTMTMAGEGTSMGMHESQSRFFENIIGRNPEFWVPLYKTLKKFFPQELKEITCHQFIQAVNKVDSGLIRIEADELTYCFHIMIRYEIEKMMIEDSVEIDKLPEIWNDKYEEYLGVRPKNPSEGILQDIHWAQGYFGYFPSYALGSAFGAQLYYHMKKKFDFEGLLREGKISVITEYLRENIHQYGKLKTSREILKDTTGEDFSPEYFIRYLKEKFIGLYELY